MDVALQKHGAKHIYRIPEGLRELCADISREVLRAQPSEIYCFIADYMDALLITRENAKVAVKVVNNILLGSESIVNILHQSGLNLEQIAIASTRIQKAFRFYLDLIDVQQVGTRDEKRVEENSRVCIREILETTGTSWDEAEAAASTIQTAFRNHYKEMLAREARGEVQWQRAVINTIAILRRAGVSQEEAARAATLIQSSYRGYYIRRNIKLKILSGSSEEGKSKNDILEPRETIQAVAWLDMMFEDSKYTIEKANEAATIIQSAYRGYRTRVHQENNENLSETESTKSMVVEAILDNLRQKIWSKVKSLNIFPEELGSREEMEETADRIETEYKNRQRKSRISDQLQDPEIRETGDSRAEQKLEVSSAEDIRIAESDEEEITQSSAGGGQDVEEEGEIVGLKEDTDAMISEADNVPEYRNEEPKEEGNSVAAQESETVAIMIEEKEKEIHKEHDDENQSNEEA